MPQQWAVPQREAVCLRDEDGTSKVPVPHGAWLSAAVPYGTKLRVVCVLRGGMRTSPCSGMLWARPWRKQVYWVFIPEDFPWDGSLRNSHFSPCSWLDLSLLLPFVRGFICQGLQLSYPQLSFIPTAGHRACAVQPGSGSSRRDAIRKGISTSDEKPGHTWKTHFWKEWNESEFEKTTGCFCPRGSETRGSDIFKLINVLWKPHKTFPGCTSTI